MPLQWLRTITPFLLFVFIVVGGTHAFAHDMYLGGTKWAIGQDRILSTIELDPALFQEIKGVEELGYDLEHLTGEQLQVLQTTVIQPYINDKLSVSVNDRSYPIQVERMEREGTFWIIWLRMSDVDLNWQENKVKMEYRLLFEETDNQHVSLGYVYFTDADDDSVQEVFDYTQPDMQYNFDSRNTEWSFSDKSAAMLTEISTFLLRGFQHILAGLDGLDHIVFLAALIVAGLSIRESLTVFGFFTAAYSTTLWLASMQIINLNARYVEGVIAFSICYIAIENLVVKKVNVRWLLAFMFGLVHGFGLAADLQEAIAGKSDPIRSVISFHIGVELGLLLVLGILLTLMYGIKKKLAMRKVTVAASAVLFMAGFIRFVDRAFNLNLIPF